MTPAQGLVAAALVQAQQILGLALPESSETRPGSKQHPCPR